MKTSNRLAALTVFAFAVMMGGFVVFGPTEKGLAVGFLGMFTVAMIGSIIILSIDNTDPTEH